MEWWSENEERTRIREMKKDLFQGVCTYFNNFFFKCKKIFCHLEVFFPIRHSNSSNRMNIYFILQHLRWRVCVCVQKFCINIFNSIIWRQGTYSEDHSSRLHKPTCTCDINIVVMLLSSLFFHIYLFMFTTNTHLGVLLK